MDVFSFMMVPPATHDVRSNRSFRPFAAAILPGMTLLEVTVVILILLTLVSILAIGAQAWIRGSDRAMCIINIQNVQKGMRSYANLSGLSPSSPAPDLQSNLIGPGLFIESTPVCPGGGVYTYGQASGADTIPPLGTLYLDCSLAGSRGHVPNSTPDW
jgi:type II secretory pathway pseudopilin PulG